MKRLIFESSPLYIFVCLALGVGYAYLLYSTKNSWSKRTNQLLFAARAIVVFVLAFLLMEPQLKLITNTYEKPGAVLLVDNSSSLKGLIDSTSFKKQLTETANVLSAAGYEVKWKDLSGKDIDKIQFNNLTSDLNSALRNVVSEYEGKNLSSIILLSDGIYNSGSSPLYSSWRVPITTIVLGDSIEHPDLILKNVAYNKIAYQGNRFPVRAEVAVQNLRDKDVKVSVFKNGKLVERLVKNSGSKSILDFDFLIEAKENGTQRLDISIETMPGETNLRNNRASIFVEVAEGKKKILLIAPAPHPDIKALRFAIEKNPNYELVVQIPNVTKPEVATAKQDYELIIFHNPFDNNQRTAGLYAQHSKGKSSLLLILGSSTNIRQLAANGIAMTFESSGQKDEVTPVINSGFSDFSFQENADRIFTRYPPVQVPFGKISYPPNAKILLHQRIGSVATDRPLLLTWEDNNKKLAAFIGEGLWKWRLDEYSSTEKSEIFDDSFSRLIQYLSTLEDKRKFRFFPIQNEFTDAAPSVFEAQVYNDLFQKVYGNKIDLVIKNEKGEQTNYNFTLTQGGERYRVGGLKEGAYRYSASTELNGKKETVSGSFLISAQNIESQNLVANTDLLRKLASSTGGRSFNFNQFDLLQKDFQKMEAKSIIHSEESFNPLIHLKWVFVVLLLLIGAEWFTRKYMGSY
jgi:hypothetical protein